MIDQFPSSLTFGHRSETFIYPTAEIDRLLSKGLSRSELAKALGITDPAFLKGDLITVDVSPKTLLDLNLRLPPGKEVGANNLFVKEDKPW